MITRELDFFFNSRGFTSSSSKIVELRTAYITAALHLDRVDHRAVSLENALYGGEMSAHHFFREFAYCDSGMIPWMQACETISTEGRPLSALVGDRMKRFPASGEINRRVTDASETIRVVREHYEALGATHTGEVTARSWIAAGTPSGSGTPRRRLSQVLHRQVGIWSTRT